MVYIICPCEDAVTQLYGFLGPHLRKHSAYLLTLHTFTHSGLRERIDSFRFNHAHIEDGESGGDML